MKYPVLCFCICVILLGLQFPSAIVSAGAPAPVRQESAIADLPDHVAYEFYFLRVAVLYTKASVKERDGNSGENLRAKITKPAGLDVAQGGELHKVALQCLSEARELDLRARSIIRQCRSKFHQGKLGARQEPPALPPELAALQSQRNAIFLHGRDLLHNELGDKFAEFDRFLRTTIGQ